MGVFHLQLENAAVKIERATSDPGTPEQKLEKKRLKVSKKPKEPEAPEKDFTPYDYSKSDFKAFAGEATSAARLGVCPGQMKGGCGEKKAGPKTCTAHTQESNPEKPIPSTTTCLRSCLHRPLKWFSKKASILQWLHPSSPQPVSKSVSHRHTVSQILFVGKPDAYDAKLWFWNLSL